MLTLDNVYRASYTLKDVVRKTDVIYAPKLKFVYKKYLCYTSLSRLLFRLRDNI